MINYNLLLIKRAIFHKVMAKRDKHEPYIEESDSIIDITSAMEDIFRKRMSDAFSQGGKAFELSINDVEDGSVISAIHGLRQQDNSVFIETSVFLANKLADTQTKKSIPHGFFVMLDCVNPVDNMPVYILMKAEPHDAVAIKASNATALQNIILSPSQKMYKAASFQQINAENGYLGYKVYLFDEQFASRAQLAEYYYKEFLGLSVNSNDKVLTKMFFVRMVETINDKYSDDYIRKNDAEAILDAEMRNQAISLNPREIINKTIEFSDREYFYRRVLREDIPTSFRKNTSLIDARMKNRSMAISDNIKIFAPQDLFQNSSFIIDRDTDDDYVIVKIAKNRV